MSIASDSSRSSVDFLGVLMPLYTHLYNLTADSFIGGNILPRENNHPLTSNEKPSAVIFAADD